MVNSVGSPQLDRLRSLVAGYIIMVVGTIAALVVLAAVAPTQAPDEAWGHAVIVAVFAVLLPLRLRAARRGSVRGLRAVGFIAAALLVVNVVEALIPGMFPIWMRIEMVAIAVLMVGVVALVVRDRR